MYMNILSRSTMFVLFALNCFSCASLGKKSTEAEMDQVENEINRILLSKEIKPINTKYNATHGEGELFNRVIISGSTLSERSGHTVAPLDAFIYTLLMDSSVTKVAKPILQKNCSVKNEGCWRLSQDVSFVSHNKAACSDGKSKNCVLLANRLDEIGMSEEANAAYMQGCALGNSSACTVSEIKSQQRASMAYINEQRRANLHQEQIQNAELSIKYGQAAQRGVDDIFGIGQKAKTRCKTKVVQKGTSAESFETVCD